MVIDGTMLAAELRRRRARPRSLADSVADVTRSTWVLGDLRSAPTSLLVLAALSLTEPTGSEGDRDLHVREGGSVEGPGVAGKRDRGAAPTHDPR